MPSRSRLLLSGRRDRWLALFAVARITGTAVAVALLLAHPVTDHDPLLTAITLVYGLGTTAAASRIEAVRRMPVVWGLDALATLGLVLVGQDWRSPFYLLALTSLILPATALAFRRALAFTAAFAAGYLATAVVNGIDWATLETTSRLESLALHMTLPLLVGLSLAYSERLLRRLEAERRHSAQLALDAERRRIARDLHDSAKQRIHAAHLVLSSVGAGAAEAVQLRIGQAVEELEAATSEMEASLTELRGPPGGGDLLDALRRRASELEAVGGIPVSVRGTSPELPPPLAAHVFHVVGEAMTNAVRHAAATAVRADLAIDGQRLVATVVDDGRGLPPTVPHESHGIRSMLDRAELVGGALTIDGNGAARGTSVRLEVPLGGAARA